MTEGLALRVCNELLEVYEQMDVFIAVEGGMSMPYKVVGALLQGVGLGPNYVCNVHCATAQSAYELGEGYKADDRG